MVKAKYLDTYLGIIILLIDIIYNSGLFTLKEREKQICILVSSNYFNYYANCCEIEKNQWNTCHRKIVTLVY